MTAYRYKVLDQKGKALQGVLQGDSERQIRQKLREQGYIPIEVHTTVSKTILAQHGKKLFTGFNQSDRLVFTRQLATLLNAGLTVEEALDACAQQTLKEGPKSIILSIRSKIMEGQTLSSAFASFPSLFGNLYQATCTSGENSGHLDTALMHLADYLEKQQELKQKIMQAILYPAIMTGVALMIVIFLLTYVVPPLVELFNDSNQTLPLSTQILMSLSEHFLKIFTVMAISVISIGGYLHFMIKKNLSWKILFHKTLLRLPLFGKIMTILNVSRFCHTLAILSSAGVNLLFATKTATLPVNNLAIRHTLDKAYEKIREGCSISNALRATGYFPAVTLYLIASGEKSGKLDLMLEKAALNLQNDIQRQLNILLTLFEPILIILMGGIVLFIVVSILLPIFNLNQLIQ